MLLYKTGQHASHSTVASPVGFLFLIVPGSCYGGKVTGCRPALWYRVVETGRKGADHGRHVKEREKLSVPYNSDCYSSQSLEGLQSSTEHLEIIPLTPEWILAVCRAPCNMQMNISRESAPLAFLHDAPDHGPPCTKYSPCKLSQTMLGTLPHHRLHHHCLPNAEKSLNRASSHIVRSHPLDS